METDTVGKVGGSTDTPCSSHQLSEELKRHLNSTLTERYGQPMAAEITASVDQLQQDVSHTEMQVYTLPLSLPAYALDLGIIYSLSLSVDTCLT